MTRRVCVAPYVWRSCLALAGLLLVASSSPAAEDGKASPPVKASELFQTARVWTVHLTFTPEQWAAMEPRQAERGRAGGRDARRDFGPGTFLAPTFIQLADTDKDGKLSRAEFIALGTKWFAEWDKAGAGQLSSEQLRTGLDAALTQAGAARPRNFMLQGQEGQRNGLSSAQGLEFDYVHADMEFQGQTFKDVGVRYKGNGTYMQSRGALKRSLKIDLNQFVKGQKLAGQSQINFHTNVTDASWMNEVLSHRLYRDAGVPAPRSAYARVYVTVPGKHDRAYMGLYSIIEDVGKGFVDERFDSKKGAILKPVTPAPFTYMGEDWAAYKQMYDPKLDMSEKEIARVIEFCKLVSQADDATFNAKLAEYLDLDQFARYMATTVYLSTLDSILVIGQNYYVYMHPKTHKLQFISWDLDHSFGQFGMGANQEQREKLSIHRPWRGNNPFLERVYKNAEFKKLYLARLEEFSRTIFAPERFHQQVDEIAAAIRPAIQEESEQKLARFDAVVANKPAQEGGLAGMFNFRQPVKPIKGFVAERTPSVIEQLSGKAEGIALDGGGFGGPGRDRGPGTFVAPAMMTALDADRNGQVTRDEFAGGFVRWFEAWDSEKTGQLTDELLQAGLNREFTPGRDTRFGGGRPDEGFRGFQGFNRPKADAPPTPPR